MQKQNQPQTGWKKALKDVLQELAVICLTTVTVFVVFPQPARGTDPTSIRGMSMAGAYTGLARGVNALFWNPANLGLSKKEAGLSLASVGLSFDNNSFSLSDYDRFTDGSLSDAEKNELLAKVPGEGLIFEAQAQATALNLSFNRFAVSPQVYGFSDLNLTHDAVELLLFDYKLGTAVDLKNSQGTAYLIGKLTAGWGQPLLNTPLGTFAFGLSASYLQGYFYSRLESREAFFSTSSSGATGRGEMTFTEADRGNGFGLDAGAAFEISPSLTLGLTVSNLFSDLTWSRGTRETRFDFNVDTMTQSSGNPDSIVRSIKQETILPEFRTHLPRTLKAGLARSGSLLSFDFDLEYRLHEDLTLSRMAAAGGGEFSLIPVMPLRAGLRWAEEEGVTLAAGAGLKLSVWYLDFAIQDKNGFGAGGQGLALGAATGFRF